jgi:hypothetical protein
MFKYDYILFWRQCKKNLLPLRAFSAIMQAENQGLLIREGGALLLSSLIGGN